MRAIVELKTGIRNFACMKAKGRVEFFSCLIAFIHLASRHGSFLEILKAGGRLNGRITAAWQYIGIGRLSSSLSCVCVCACTRAGDTIID